MAGARRCEPGARGCRRTPACLGRRLLSAERASQKPVWGAQEHAARDDRTIRQGLGYHMERKRDAFKAKLSAAPIRGHQAHPGRYFCCRIIRQEYTFAE